MLTMSGPVEVPHPLAAAARTPHEPGVAECLEMPRDRERALRRQATDEPETRAAVDLLERELDEDHRLCGVVDTGVDRGGRSRPR
jgi:hypothetical protein